MRDHLVDVQMQGVTADHDQHAGAFRRALEATVVPECNARMDERAIHCALAAADAEALAACDTAKAAPPVVP